MKVSLFLLLACAMRFVQIHSCVEGSDISNLKYSYSNLSPQINKCRNNKLSVCQNGCVRMTAWVVSEWPHSRNKNRLLEFAGYDNKNLCQTHLHLSSCKYTYSVLRLAEIPFPTTWDGAKTL